MKSKIILLSFFLSLCLPICLLAQTNKPKNDPILQKKLSDAVKDFKGTVGIYVRNLKTGQTAYLNADSIFPTASMIKVPITIGIMDKIEKGELHYHDKLVYKDSLLYAGEDILGSFKDSSVITLSKVIMLMITTSDNTASLWCQSLAGTGTAINKILEDYGFRHTRVNSRTPGRENARKIYGWGQTTPREMADLFVSIREGKLISPAASERIYRNLTRIYWDEEALSEIPPYVQVASKQGAVNESRSEVVLVNGPSGDYVFCIITKNLQDTSWKYTNAGYVLIRNISRLLWNYFEPTSDWKPASGLEKYYAD
ncbi:serine hydrolase [Cytophagaceae bacterium DM2B3-1]|uniref:beta-lactamase n=1 Tax=Xanthocytophaga flava TaxID=3048013 RepID=A0ABT7CTR5_9BACT|nr:serine hydrolase [Xanthocytophaga flavus]MDJ1471959.1 serine hydrolase [Xanthocytophaga flavus]MDJ1496896.1 serine hydrolase [Xanthocytophaga flavus]